MLDLPCPLVGRQIEDRTREPSKSTVCPAPRPDYNRVFRPDEVNHAGTQLPAFRRAGL